MFVTQSRRPILPWLVLSFAALAYMIAIINRSSLASLGPTAQEHFRIDATVLSSFAVIQLVVYAGMQIPVGVLLDRFGSTVMILSGGLLMTLGQLVMATVQDVSLAILARVLVGAGDACTFISVIRILPDWFSVRQLPTVTQLTAQFGQLGQLVSVTPLALAVGAFGWATGFVGVAATGLLVTLLAAFVLRDRPGTGTAFERLTGRLGNVSRNAVSLGVTDNTAVLAAVAPPATSMMATVQPRKPHKREITGIGFFRNARSLLSLPGVRLAYWAHFTPPFCVSVFVLLWGTPFLVGGVGLSESAAGGLLSLTILTGMVTGALLGPVSSRYAERRVHIVIAVCSLILLTWLAVLLWPGAPPVWLLTVLMVVIAFGGPASMIAFEIARSHTPRSQIGFGTGLVNTGGFIAALLVIFFIGLILDALGAGSPENYTLKAFKWAFAVQVPILALGLIMLLIELRRTTKWMRKHGRKLR